MSSDSKQKPSKEEPSEEKAFSWVCLPAEGKCDLLSDYTIRKLGLTIYDIDLEKCQKRCKKQTYPLRVMDHTTGYTIFTVDPARSKLADIVTFLNDKFPIYRQHTLAKQDINGRTRTISLDSLDLNIPVYWWWRGLSVAEGFRDIETQTEIMFLYLVPTRLPLYQIGLVTAMLRANIKWPPWLGRDEHSAPFEDEISMKQFIRPDNADDPFADMLMIRYPKGAVKFVDKATYIQAASASGSESKIPVDPFTGIKINPAVFNRIKEIFVKLLPLVVIDILDGSVNFDYTNMLLSYQGKLKSGKVYPNTMKL